jgi:hypothetical protein
MVDKKFKSIREPAFQYWLSELNRQRAEGQLSDRYADSYICKWQHELLDEGRHCSFLCSIGDWLDNISDLLDDRRYDELGNEDNPVLFRYYTRLLLVVSELLEDFVSLHALITGLKKGAAGQELEIHGFQPGELKQLSDFINSVCKHKTERDNLHVHNHHLDYEFEDFGAVKHANQISLDELDWKAADKDTTILMPTLEKLIGTVIRLNHIFDQLLTSEPGYQTRLVELFSSEWQPTGSITERVPGY